MSNKPLFLTQRGVHRFNSAGETSFETLVRQQVPAVFELGILEYARKIEAHLEQFIVQMAHELVDSDLVQAQLTDQTHSQKVAWLVADTLVKAGFNYASANVGQSLFDAIKDSGILKTLVTTAVGQIGEEAAEKQEDSSSFESFMEQFKEETNWDELRKNVVQELFQQPIWFATP